MVSEKRHKAYRPAHSRKAARRPSSFIRTIPSAPASDRICWPCVPAPAAACRPDDPSARGLVRERTYRRWGIAPRPEDVCGCRRTGVRIL